MMLGEWIIISAATLGAWWLIGSFVLAWIDDRGELARWADARPPGLLCELILVVGWPVIAWKYCAYRRDVERRER